MRSYFGPRDDFLSWIAARVDVAVDPIAYGGQTTTADSLASGVPVMSMTGESIVARFWPYGVTQWGAYFYVVTVGTVARRCAY